jgi:hypothetical protein
MAKKCLKHGHFAERLLRPGLYDQLEEATLNAALAIIEPRSELQALLAVQIATGFAGLRYTLCRGNLLCMGLIL